MGNTIVSLYSNPHLHLQGTQLNTMREWMVTARLIVAWRAVFINREVTVSQLLIVGLSLRSPTNKQFKIELTAGVYIWNNFYKFIARSPVQLAAQSPNGVPLRKTASYVCTTFPCGTHGWPAWARPQQQQGTTTGMGGLETQVNVETLPSKWCMHPSLFLSTHLRQKQQQ